MESNVKNAKVDDDDDTTKIGLEQQEDSFPTTTTTTTTSQQENGDNNMTTLLIPPSQRCIDHHPPSPPENDIYEENCMNLSLLDPARYGWMAIGGIADIITPHERDRRKLSRRSQSFSTRRSSSNKRRRNEAFPSSSSKRSGINSNGSRRGSSSSIKINSKNSCRSSKGDDSQNAECIMNGSNEQNATKILGNDVDNIDSAINESRGTHTAIKDETTPTNPSKTSVEESVLVAENHIESSSSVDQQDNRIPKGDNILLGSLKTSKDDEVADFDNNGKTNAVENPLTQLLEPNILATESRTEISSAAIQESTNTLDILAYHRGREKYDLQNTKHLLDDAKSMIVAITIEIPLSSATENGTTGSDGDFFCETIQWDLANMSMPNPFIVASQIGTQFGLSYAMIWDLANSIQTQIQHYVNDNCTYTSPLYDDPELVGQTSDNRKPITTVPQLYGSVTGFTQVGGICTAPISRCKPPPTVPTIATTTSKCGESITTMNRSLSTSQRSMSNGSTHKHQPTITNKSRLKIDPLQIVKTHRRVVPKLPMSEFPKEVTHGIELDTGFYVDYRTLFTAEGSFLVTNEVDKNREISLTEISSPTPVHNEVIAPVQVVEDGSVDFCNVCKTVGNLLCCDFCPRAFHCQCISSDAIPESMNDESKWECPSCIIERNGLPDDNITETLILDTLVATYHVDMEDVSSVQHITVLSILHEMLRILMNYDFGDMFRSPVNCREIPTYKTIVKNPMDLGTITNNLEKGYYKAKTLEGIVISVLKDVELVWHNCFIFNVEGSAVYRMANIHKRRAYSIRQCSFDHMLSDFVKGELSSYVSTLELERDNHRRLDALTMKPRQAAAVSSSSPSRHKISAATRNSVKGRPVAILDADSGRIMKIYTSMQAACNALNFIFSLKRHECEWELNELDSLNKMRKLIIQSNSDPNVRVFGYRWLCLDALRKRRVQFVNRTSISTPTELEENGVIPEETVKEELVELVSESKSFLFHSIVEALSFPSLPGNTSTLHERLEALVSGTDFEMIGGNMWKRSDVDDLETYGIEFVKEDTLCGGDAVILCGFVDIVAAHEDWIQTLDASIGSNEESRSLDIFSRVYLDQDRTVDGLRWRRLSFCRGDSNKTKAVVHSQSICDSTNNTTTSVSGVRQDTSSTDTHSTSNSNASHVYDLETVPAPRRSLSPNRKARAALGFGSSSKFKRFDDIESSKSILPLPLSSDNGDTAVDSTLEASAN